MRDLIRRGQELTTSLIQIQNLFMQGTESGVTYYFSMADVHVE